jgi:hypothetical protein
MLSRFWYFAAFCIFVAGIVGAAFFGISRFGDLENALIRVVVPGEGVLDLNEAGTYTIFHESTGTVDGVVYSAADISGLRVALQSTETGAEIPLARPTANASYNFGGSSGVGIFAFDIETPGPYRLSAAYDDGRAEPQAILSVASGFVSKLLGTIFGAIGIVFGSIVLAIVIAIVTFVRRRRARSTAPQPAAE